VDGFPTKGNDNEIVVWRISETELEVHLGFLRHRCTYEITFPLKIPDHIPNEFDWSPDVSLSNPYITLKSFDKMGTEVQVIMEFQASKTPQMRETLRFRDTTRPSQFLDLIFVAKVMSKAQGTPSLKLCIHQIGAEPDEESEASDFQGFE